MWTTIDNYDHSSRNPFCSVTGLPKLPGEQFVFRLADIEFEGSFDIGEQVVRDMAAKLGMVPGDHQKALLDELAETEQAFSDAQSEIIELEQDKEELKLEIAKLTVLLHDLTDSNG